MTYLVAKAAISGILVLIISEVVRLRPSIGGLIASVPLISVLSFIWVWQETADPERIAAQSQSTFWFVLPSLPMFLLLPVLLRTGVAFWWGLLACCVLTAALYLGMAWLLPRYGVDL
jgi:hypothetical protein